MSHRPRDRSIRSAYTVCELAVTSRWMCCETEKSLAILTPSTFKQRLRVIPGSGAGSGTEWVVVTQLSDTVLNVAEEVGSVVYRTWRMVECCYEQTGADTYPQKFKCTAVGRRQRPYRRLNRRVNVYSNPTATPAGPVSMKYIHVTPAILLHDFVAQLYRATKLKYGTCACRTLHIL